jgi:glycosyltransferase involved in cell wall biosynthesis
MKVGFICQPFDDCAPPVPNGSIALLTWELARRLSGSYQVTVCAPHLAEQRRTEEWEGVRFIRFGLKPDRRLLDRPRGLNGPLSESRADAHSILYCMFYALRCAARLRSERCDIVHIHNFSQFVPIARLLNRRAKIILHMNCDWLAQFDRHLIGARIRRADAIVSSSQYITDRVKARFPPYADRCVTIFNGADVHEFADWCRQEGRPGNGKRFIFVGRVSPEKGVHVLLEAFKKVLARESSAELKIIGAAQIPPASFIVDLHSDPVVQDLRRFYRSDYMEYLQNQSRSIPDDRVSFAGFVPHNQLPGFLREADIFVQPSVWDEPFGIPVIEAMAAGLPVVSSRSGGLPEIVVDRKTGLLVEANNPSALAGGMLQLLAEKNVSRSMGLAGAARVRELFSWEAVTARLKSLYCALDSGVPVTSV